VNVSLYIARRYFIAKKSTNAITIISWISVLAIAVGTGALVIILSGMNGLTGLVETLYNSFNPDMKITSAAGKVFTADEKLMLSLQQVEGVAFVSKTLDDNMLLKYENSMQIVRVKGVDRNFLPVTRFDTLLAEGTFLAPSAKEKQVVLGKGVAYRLGISLGDMFNPVTIYCPRRGKTSSINPEEAFNEARAYPSGLFSINDDFDFTYALINYETARDILEYPANSASALEISLKPGADAAQVQQTIMQLAGKGLVVQNKYEQNDVLFKTLQTEKLWTFIILAFVLLIATFNIIGALTMLIIEKKKDIKILSALGADVSLIRKIFMAEGLMIIFIGSLIGILLGYGLCLLQQRYGLIRFEEGYIIDSYPVETRLGDFVAIAATVLGIGFLAAIYPVRVFTRQNLVTAID
jgi:lipoprotein-releasing system permease protein